MAYQNFKKYLNDIVNAVAFLEERNESNVRNIIGLLRQNERFDQKNLKQTVCDYLKCAQMCGAVARDKNGLYTTQAETSCCPKKKRKRRKCTPNRKVCNKKYCYYYRPKRKKSKCRRRRRSCSRKRRRSCRRRRRSCRRRRKSCRRRRRRSCTPKCPNVKPPCKRRRRKKSCNRCDTASPFPNTDCLRDRSSSRTSTRSQIETDQAVRFTKSSKKDI